MSLILVVEPENDHGEPVHQALATEGFTVKVVGSGEEALRAAAYEAPSIVLVSGSLPSATETMDAFATKRGGPGVVALLDDAEQTATFQPHADHLLVGPTSPEAYREAVQKTLSLSPQAAAPTPAAADRKKLSSEEIFGDLIEEVEEEGATPPKKASSQEIFGDLIASLEEDEPAPEAAPSPPIQEANSVVPAEPVPPAAAAPRPPRTPARRPAAQDEEIQRELERTLSGLLAPEGRAKKAAPRTKSPGGRSAEDARDIDALLSATLSSLDLKPKPKKKGPPPVPAPEPAPEPGSEPAKPSVKEGSLAEASAEMLESTSDGANLSAVSQTSGYRPISAGQEFGQYTLLEKIAVGGMAEVWKARMRGVEGFQKTVAIKKILNHLTDNESFVTMFIDEAKLAAQLSHPNITHIYDLGKLGDDYYIAMEFIEGRNLRALLTAAQRSDLRMPAGLALLVGARLASALDYAHRKRGFDERELGLVHRDVSPQNVLISYEGDIKLCDFGIVKAVSRAQHTQMGALKGKLQYMSPEQAWGRKVDRRSDLFSLGALLFEMLAGRRLFPGDNEFSVLEAVRECEVPAIREIDASIPEPVAALVSRALQKDPSERFQSAGEMQQEIESLLYAISPAPSQADLAGFLHEVLSRGTGALAPEATAPEAPKPEAAENGAETPGEAAPEPPAPTVVTAPTPAPEPTIAPEAAEPAAAQVELISADELAAQPAPVEPPPESEEQREGQEVSRVVEVVLPTDTADTKLLQEGNRGRWWILLLFLALAALAVVAWTVMRSRQEPATTPPATTQPAMAPAALPEPDSALDADPQAPGEPEGGEFVDGSGEQVPPPTDLGALDVEQLVDEELARREAALRADFEAQERQLEEQIAKVRKSQSGASAEAAPGEEKRDATDEPPEELPGSRPLAWVVKPSAGEYSAQALAATAS